MKPVTEIDRRFDEATHRSAGAASVDPVCGMTVDSNSAAGSFEYKDKRTSSAALIASTSFDRIRRVS